MKKIFHFMMFAGFLLTLSGCQMSGTASNTGATPVPYTRGPNSAPHVEGPNINLPAQGTENIEFTLPKKPKAELKNN